MPLQVAIVLLLGSILTVTTAHAAVTELDRELIEAVNYNQDVRVTALLDAGADVNARIPPLQMTALIMASDVNFNADKKISLSIVRLLVARGANVNAQDREGLTPLMKAIGSYDLNVVKHLLDSGAQIDAYDQRGHTALTHAIMRSQPRMLQMLIEHGARTDVQSHMGTTPWSIAQVTHAAALTMSEHEHTNHPALHADSAGTSGAVHAPPPHAMRSKSESIASTQAVLEILKSRGIVKPQREITSFDSMATHQHH